MKLVSSSSTVLCTLLLLAARRTAESFSPTSSGSLSRQASALEAGRLYAGPKSARRRRTPRSSRSTISEIARERSTRTLENVVDAPFDGKALTAVQEPNEKTARPLDLRAAIQDEKIRVVLSKDDESYSSNLRFGTKTASPAFQFLSLKDLFGVEFAECFHSSSAFRNNLRLALRRDVFDTTPAYANLSEKAAKVLLLPDSSLQGSWRKPADMKQHEIRMKETTAFLAKALGEGVLTGDDIMHKIGDLCGANPSTHWIDIVGVQDRIISHSFHQDTGLSPNHSKTVLWGFPPEDNYCGTGVFSHIVELAEECEAPADHPHMQPVLLDGKIPNDCIIRPEFAVGKELLVYRDVDVIHSSPDVSYRTSVMRFM